MAQVRWHKTQFSAQFRLNFPYIENIIFLRAAKVTIVFIDVFSAYIKLLYLSVVFYDHCFNPSYMKMQPSLASCNSSI